MFCFLFFFFKECQNSIYPEVLLLLSYVFTSVWTLMFFSVWKVALTGVAHLSFGMIFVPNFARSTGRNVDIGSEKM